MIHSYIRHMPEYVVEFGKVGAPPKPDGRLDAPAFHRNHEAIWPVLSPFLTGKSGNVLELGSGTGQHVVAFARQSQNIIWWPSDANANHLRSINAWRTHEALSNVQSALRIDLLQPDWDLQLPASCAAEKFLAIFCANVLHIAPWQVSENILKNAARILCDDGRLFIYGPFMRDGQHTAESNASFDQSLRHGNPEWGVRDINDIKAVATQAGLELFEIVDMPANNFILIFGRGGAKFTR